MGGVVSPPLSTEWGVGSEGQSPPVQDQPRTPPALPQALVHICVSVTSARSEGREEDTRVNACVQHLREATEMGEREPSQERTPHHQRQEGLVGWRWRGAGKKGLSGPGGGEGAHRWAVDSLLSSQARGREWPWAKPPGDGRGFNIKINIFEFHLR